TEAELAAASAQSTSPAPSSAVIDPPPPAAAPEAPLAIPSSINEAAGDRVTQSYVRIRDVRGDRVDPDTLFGEPNEAKLVRCQVRLIQHSTATAYDRPVETVLLPAGAEVSLQTAHSILAVITAEPAGDAPDEG
ncbi:MAG TPA: hypothetical protein VGF17_12720, partial [Phytomonospora sp.]